MKKTAIFTSLFFAATMITAGGALSAGESSYGTTSKDSATSTSGSATMGQEQDSATAGSTAAMSGQQKRISSANDLQSFKVQDAQGQELGQISQVLIDVEEGKVGYAVVSSGGVLGMGEEQFIVPFKALELGEGEKTLVLDMQKEKLQQAPKADVQQVQNEQTGEEIHQFYGVSPYWEEAGQQQESQYGLPAGHPPVNDDKGRVDPPPSGAGKIPPAHPPISDELPPGHPPVDNQ